MPFDKQASSRKDQYISFGNHFNLLQFLKKFALKSMNSKEFSANKKNKFAKQVTQNLKRCGKKRICYDSVIENQNLKIYPNLSKKPNLS